MSKKLHFMKSGSPKSEDAFRVFTDRFSQHPLNDCDVVVCLGGDGFLLQVLRDFPEISQPIFAMNRGTIGFLLNEYSEDSLLERINNSNSVYLNPIKMEATDAAGNISEYRAFNEVSVLRYSAQSANLEIKINDRVALDHLSCDGVLVSTPAGSTAYNLSAHGPIIPLSSNLLALTPVSPFRPRRWKGALLPNNSVVEIVNLDPVKRPIGAAADTQEVRDAVKIKVWQPTNEARELLFDKDQSLEDRIMYEQFKS